MIDALDKQTQALPLEQPKRGRGRPKTGQAMTSAEKQKAYRDRQKAAAGNVTENTDTNTTKSLELLRERALSRGRTCIAQARMIAELEKRVELAEARADAMGNELAIVKAQLSNPARKKKHRDDPAIELPEEKTWTLQTRTGRGMWQNIAVEMPSEEASRQLDRVIDMKLHGEGKLRTYRIVEDGNA